MPNYGKVNRDDLLFFPVVINEKCYNSTMQFSDFTPRSFTNTSLNRWRCFDDFSASLCKLSAAPRFIFILLVVLGIRRQINLILRIKNKLCTSLYSKYYELV